MGQVVSYNPYTKKFHFNEDSLWSQTIWATSYATNISQTAQQVFTTLVLHVQDVPLKFPSQQTIGDIVGRSVRTIERAIQELKSLKLIAIPEKCGRRNKFTINEYTDADLHFSEQAGNMLKSLLSVKVSVFTVTPDKNDGIKSLNDKNGGIITEREEKEEEKSLPLSSPHTPLLSLSLKEEEKEERDIGLVEPDIPSTPVSQRVKMEQRMQKISQTAVETKQKRMPKWLTSNVKVQKPVTQWTTVDVEWYFASKYRELSGNIMQFQPQKHRILIKRYIEKLEVSLVHIKEVIDFTFENWDELVRKLKLVEPYPSIGMVFSGYFETLSNLQRGGFASNSLAKNRSEDEVQFDFSANEYKPKPPEPL